MSAHRPLLHGGGDVRVTPWRGDLSTAYLVASKSRPSTLAVRLVVDSLAADGWRAALTGALPPEDQRPFLQAGFEVHERLHLLRRSIDDIPDAPDAGLRRSRRRDRDAIVDLDEAAFMPFWHLDSTGLDDALAATPSSRLRVATAPEDDEAITGYAVTGRAGSRGYLQRLGVDPDRRRQGVATALVVDGLRWLRRWGAHEVLVNTQVSNSGALALYESLGFRREPGGLAVLRLPIEPTAVRVRRAAARWLVAGCALLGVAVPLAPVAARPGPVARTAQADGALTLLAQTATVAPGGRFEATVAVGDAAADSTIEVAVHGRVRSRSELAASAEGVGLRGVVHSSTTELEELPSSAEGGRRVAVSLDPTAQGSATLTAAGAYPVRLTFRDPDGANVATLVTHLLLEPDEADDLPPLAVAVVADLAMAPARRADGRVELPRAGRAADLLAATSAHDVGVSLAVSPEVVEALLDTEDPDGQRLLEALLAAADEDPVLALPYAPTSPDALVAADLDPVLGIELDEGRRTLESALGSPPQGGTWWAAPDLGPDGVRLLALAGLERVVLPDSQVVDLDDATGGLTLAQPFAVGDGDEDEALSALAVDRTLVDRLTAEGSAALDVSRTLADLAMIWFERPGVARSTVLPLDLSVPPAVAGPLLAGVQGSRLFEAVDLDDAFTHADPLERRGRPVVAELDPESGEEIDPAVARDLPGARTILGSFTGLVGEDSPRLRPMVSHLLLASSTAGDRVEQRGHLDSARSVVGAVTSAVTTPPQERITLTAREGTVPLTIQNGSGGPVNVSVRLRSPRLDFPEGDVIPLRLEEATTRLNVAVEARASGSFPLDVEITSPDGVLVLSTTDYSVQSTAVSGVGLFLSIGAALFLLVWWARHWSRTRRSAKLVTTSPPAHLAGEERAGQEK